MEEFQKRIDRLTAVVTASISIDDSHHGLKDTRNVTRFDMASNVLYPAQPYSNYILHATRHKEHSAYYWMVLLHCIAAGVFDYWSGVYIDRVDGYESLQGYEEQEGAESIVKYGWRMEWDNTGISIVCP